MTEAAEHPVVVVTGGGGGIGAAIAMEVARWGAYVVTVDPLVTVDGTGHVESAEPTTAERIVAAGGMARASATSVTDAEAVRALFDELVAEHGRLDAVVNVAGITRPTGFATGTDDDWAAVLSVHLDGYRNVLAAALPIMAAAGSGRIVGVTSGSGWRAADAGAYSCAKRAVASLTWQLGRAAPAGVRVNAVSPIALTRMVTEAMKRAKAAAPSAPAARSTPTAGPGTGRATGGLSLGGMPSPDELGPLGAHLALPGGTTMRGQVLFTGGSEVAPVRPPRLLEVVRIPGNPAVLPVLDAVLDSWVAAEAKQRTTGGANPRFAGLFDEEDLYDPSRPAGPDADGRRVLVVASAALSAIIQMRLESSGATVVAPFGTGPASPPTDLAAMRELLDHVAATHGGLDAVVVEAGDIEGDWPGGDPDDAPPAAPPTWSEILDDHAGLPERIAHDARWARAVADHSADTGAPIRLVTLVEAATPSGRSRAQAAAQLARAAAGATDGRVTAVAVSVEARDRRPMTTAVAAVLAVDERALGLGGAELVVGAGWAGLRSHPTPAGTVVFGGPELPPWFEGALAEIAGAEGGR